MPFCVWALAALEEVARDEGLDDVVDVVVVRFRLFGDVFEGATVGEGHAADLGPSGGVGPRGPSAKVWTRLLNA